MHSREEFYELERTSLIRYEFYAGNIVAMAGGSPRRGRIIGEATRILSNALQDRDCFAAPNDQMVRVEDEDPDAYPDVVVYCENATFDARFSRTLTKPLVLIEVLSPSTKTTDRMTKLDAYFKLATLTDYLIVWQDKIRLDQFVGATNSTEEPQLKRHPNRDSRVGLKRWISSFLWVSCIDGSMICPKANCNMSVDELKAHLSAAFDDGPDRELTFVPMFGGACAYVNGRVFAWLFKFGLSLKINEETAKIWAQDGARPLQFDPDGPIFKAHIVVPAPVIKDAEKFVVWVDQSVQFILSQPPPKPRSRRKKKVS